MIGIESRFVCNPVAELPLKSGEGISSGLVIVEIAQHQGISVECRNRLADIGDRVEDNSVGTVIESEAFSRKKVYEALENIAARVAIDNTGYILWRITPLEKGVAKLKSVSVISKAYGIIMFAM